MLNKQEIFEDRGYECECGCEGKGEDLHHWFYRSKNFPYFDCPEGVVLITHKENISRKYDTIEGRKKFWKIQCDRFGKSHMLKWLKNMPGKIDRKRIDFL